MNDLEDIEQPVSRCTREARHRRFGRRDGSDFSIPVGPTGRLVSSFASLSTRKQDIRMHVRSILEDEVTVRLPRGFRVKNLPETMKQDTPFGTFPSAPKTRSARSPSKVKSPSTETRITPAEYAGFRAFCEGVDRALLSVSSWGPANETTSLVPWFLGRSVLPASLAGEPKPRLGRQCRGGTKRRATFDRRRKGRSVVALRAGLQRRRRRQGQRGARKLDKLPHDGLYGSLARAIDDGGHGNLDSAADAYLSAIRASRSSSDPRAPLVAWFSTNHLLGLAPNVSGLWAKRSKIVDEGIEHPGSMGWRARGELVSWWTQEAYEAAQSGAIEASAQRHGCLNKIRLAGPFGHGAAQDRRRAFAAEQPGRGRRACTPTRASTWRPTFSRPNDTGARCEPPNRCPAGSSTPRPSSMCRPIGRRSSRFRVLTA